MPSEVYISLQENSAHLIVQGELVLLEKLIRALRGNHSAEIQRADVSQRTVDQETSQQEIEQ